MVRASVFDNTTFMGDTTCVNVKNVNVLRANAVNKRLNAVNGRKRDNTAYTEVTS